MSRTEQFQAAIERLESLKAGSTPGPWHAFVAPGEHWYILAGPESVAWISSNDGGNEAQREPNADLIETLHATVDAQLALLRSGLRWAELDEAGLVPDFAAEYELTLARAIIEDRS